MSGGSETDTGDQLSICFIAAAIGEEESPTRTHADSVRRHIIDPVCGEVGYTTVRADDITSAGMISSEVVSQLLGADLVIADLTELNPNVFYELAVRHVTSKPFVQIAERSTVIPFDVSNVRTLLYDLTDLDSVNETKARLTALLVEFRQSDTEVSNPLTSALSSARYRLIRERPVTFSWDHTVAILGGMARDIEEDFQPEMVLTMSGPGSFVACYFLGVVPREPMLFVAQTFPVKHERRTLTASQQELLESSGYRMVQTNKWDVALPPALVRAPRGTRVLILDDKVISGTTQRVVRELLEADYGLDVRCAGLTAQHEPVDGRLEWVGEVCEVLHYFPWGRSTGRHRR